ELTNTNRSRTYPHTLGKHADPVFSERTNKAVFPITCESNGEYSFFVLSQGKRYFLYIQI
ncbi:hypothetical protein ACFSO0_05915, partial [Brevibacillus sp. GCM10020057]|uniref:hypothetical protein n=1 Tax=Brevibacillus sp. GCM10020057 TaxID=3317327 RepID=UPI00362ED277